MLIGVAVNVISPTGEITTVSPSKFTVFVLVDNLTVLAFTASEFLVKLWVANKLTEPVLCPGNKEYGYTLKL